MVLLLLVLVDDAKVTGSDLQATVLLLHIVVVEVIWPHWEGRA